MTKDQLLEKAKKDYPIGTKIKYLDGGGNTCPDEVNIEKSSNLYRIFGDFSIDAGIGKGYLYANGKWAEIISKPIEHMIKYTIKDLKTKQLNLCWVVKIDNETQHAQLRQYFPRMQDYNKDYNAYLIDLSNTGLGNYDRDYKSTEYNKIEFNQIEFMEKKKTIIGYRLIKPEYREAALKIYPHSVYLSSSILRTSTGKNYISEDCITASEMERAGVLNIWFEPVYEEEPEVVSMGNGAFNLTIKDKKVFHKSEDITEYIKQVNDWHSNIRSSLGFSKWAFDFKDIILSKTGCEFKETKLSEWLEIYNKIK